MTQINPRYTILAGIVALVIALFVYLSMSHPRSVIANDPNPCANPSIAQSILVRVNEIQKSNGGKLSAIDMQDAVTVSRSADGTSLECHAIFVMSNGDHTPGVFSMKPNVAGQPLIEFKPD